MCKNLLDRDLSYKTDEVVRRLVENKNLLQASENYKVRLNTVVSKCVLIPPTRQWPDNLQSAERQTRPGENAEFSFFGMVLKQYTIKLKLFSREG